MGICGFSVVLKGGVLVVIACAMPQQNQPVCSPAHAPHRQQGCACPKLRQGRTRTPAQVEYMRRIKSRRASKYKAPAHYCYGGNLINDSGRNVTHEESQKIMNDIADESITVDGQKWYDQMDVRDADNNGVLDCDEPKKRKPASKKQKAKRHRK